MSTGTAFRFVHASDLRLEQPPYGVSEVPEHLRELLVQAPYLAAQRVFDAAIAEGADFLVLAGDVLDTELTGPRGPVFLARQLDRLHEHGIAVYWAAGEVDPPARWPQHVALPDNVHRFSFGADEMVHRRDGVALVRVSGRNPEVESGDSFTVSGDDASGLFSLAVAHGVHDVEPLHGSGIDYWALGGRHDAHTPDAPRGMAHFPGSPQGRCPAETGPHGCTLVSVDDRGRIRQQQIYTDVFRWRQETLSFNETTTGDELRRLCHQRVSDLLDDETDVPQLIAWTVRGHGPLARSLRQEGLDAELLDDSRTEFGYRSPATWSVSLQYEPADVLGAWDQDDSFLGDLLAEVRAYQQDPEAELDLKPYLASAGHSPELLAPRQRDRLLQQVAELGVHLLGHDLSTKRNSTT